MRKLFTKMETQWNAFNDNHFKFTDKGNKAAATRARKAAGEFKKLVTEYGDIVGLRNNMRNAADNAGLRFENEIVATTVDMMQALTGIKTGSSSDGNIGKMET